MGNVSVGKSSLCTSLLNKEFSPDHRSTIGTAFVSVAIEPERNEMMVNHEKVLINVWDTAGEERFRAMTRFYLRNTTCAILVFDVTQASTLTGLRSWHEDVSKACPNAAFVVCANKVDVVQGNLELRQVSQQDGMDFAESIGAKYRETSAKTGECVNSLFALAAGLSEQAILNEKNDVFYKLT